ncbi:hypothetical protein FH972_021396 [Carpinus fangiana]|uniref:Ketopantoate reductase C-terminal domain-containing protein n=1 Tax=Carpinus fangiana TaxID=176857 RepID=A0A5N6KP80_9ROSI|nr:hypothetical protein FH972_021396 [Carpinus fangiana]
MPPSAIPRLRILSVGGNAVSAFLSWRLQATNACDVTLVWKAGFESVSQYGISFKSSAFGNERFKPHAVVRTPEEASQTKKAPFDYVLLCIKALPDVYDLASVIESVVTPQHTCILINTTHSLGIESFIEKRFPKNVVLSLVSAASITQLGPAEFEHAGDAAMWVGPANFNKDIPAQIQGDMAEALAMTLGSGQVNCTVSKNIQQQQFERMAGPIAFHTASVIFETPNHAELLELPGVRELVSDTLDEVVRIANARQCSFPTAFKDEIIQEMITPKDTQSIMYQDYAARRPMEVETYLGSPMKLAKDVNIPVPRIQTLYAMLHHINIANQKRKNESPVLSSPVPGAGPGPGPRMSSMGPPRGAGPNGTMMGPPPGSMGPMRGRGGRAASMTGPPPPPRRGPSMNGYPPMGHPHAPMQPQHEESALDDFAHLVMYDDSPVNGFGGDVAMRERELMLRQKEIALRERELAMGGGYNRGPRPRAPPSAMGDFDEDDGEDYFDPMAYRGPPVDPDNVDMMSITSRRNRKQPSMSQMRHNPEGPGGPRRGNPYGRQAPPRNRPGSRMMQDNLPSPHENMMDNPMLGYSSDRYGGADRMNIGRESRTNSLTAARLNELSEGPGYGGYPSMSRRASQSPGGMPMAPVPMGQRRPSPGNGYGPPNGMRPNGRPSPPDMRQPVPRHPPGHGNSVAPQQVEQTAGVSSLYPPKNGVQVRSLTGSASASAGSGDSGQSAHVESGNSAYSSQSSLGPRPSIGVR